MGRYEHEEYNHNEFIYDYKRQIIGHAFEVEDFEEPEYDYVIVNDKLYEVVEWKLLDINDWMDIKRRKIAIRIYSKQIDQKYQEHTEYMYRLAGIKKI